MSAAARIACVAHIVVVFVCMLAVAAAVDALQAADLAVDGPLER